MLKHVWEELKGLLILIGIALYTFGPCTGVLVIIAVLILFWHKRQSVAKG